MPSEGQIKRVAMAGGALDDGVEPRHVPGRALHLLLIGLGDGRLHAAQLAKAVEEAVGGALQLLDRARQHRVLGGAVGQRAQHGLAQQQDLGEQVRARLVDVAVDQVLQAPGLAFEQRQDPVGFAHLAHVVPGRAQHLRAVPDHRHQHDHHGGVQRRDRQDAPADRHRPQHADQTRAQPPDRAGRPSASSLCPGAAKKPHSTLRMRSISAAAAGSRRGLGVDRRHRVLERLAVDIPDDGDAGGLRLALRLLLEVAPFLAHEIAGARRGLPEDLLVVGRQAAPGLERDHQHLRAHRVLGQR